MSYCATALGCQGCRSSTRTLACSTGPKQQLHRRRNRKGLTEGESARPAGPRSDVASANLRHRRARNNLRGDTVATVSGDIASAAGQQSHHNGDGPAAIVSALYGAPRWNLEEGRQYYEDMLFHRGPLYQVIRVSQSGETQQERVTRKQLLRESGLRPRDLRRIDPSFSSFNRSPAILVRDGVLLIKMSELRAVIAYDHAYVFQSHTDDAQYFLQVLTSRLRNLERAASCAQSQMSDKEQAAEVQIPFSLEVVEAALVTATGRLEGELAQIQPSVKDLLGRLPQEITPEVLEALRHRKEQLVELLAKVEAVRDVFEELLEDEDDVRAMTLRASEGGNPSRVQFYLQSLGAEAESAAQEELIDEEEEEVEMLLEYYLQRCEAMHSEAERLLQVARDMEDSISVNLSSRRYELSRLELLLSIISLAVATGALVTGIFGMNLTSRLEVHPSAFLLTVAAIVVFAFLIVAVCLWYTRRRRIM